MNGTYSKTTLQEDRDAIDAYLECTTYCSPAEKENDFRIIYME